MTKKKRRKMMLKLIATTTVIGIAGIFWLAETPLPDTAAEESVRKNSYNLILLEEYEDCILRDTLKGDIRQRTDIMRLSKSSITRLKAEAEKIRNLCDDEADEEERYRLMRYAENLRYLVCRIEQNQQDHVI